MKIYFGGLVVLILVIAFSSCQKEVEGSLQPAAGDTVLIRSVIYFDTTKAASLDTISKTEFFYDNTERLVRGNSSEYEYLPAPSVYTFYYDFFYIGSNKQPFKVTSRLGLVSAPFTSYLFYDNNNFEVKDSGTRTPFTEATISNFSAATGGRFAKVEKRKDLATGTETTGDSVIFRRTLSGGNIIDGDDTVYRPLAGARTIRYEYSYDNKKNPFASIALSRRYLGHYSFTGDGYILPIGANNATRFFESYIDGINVSQVSGTINYTYRSDGLPLTGSISGFPAANKVVFRYYN